MNYELTYTHFYPEGMIVIEYTIDGIPNMITIDASYADFDKFLPDVEGDFQDEEGKYNARFDKFGNLHWIYTDFNGYVSYVVKNCNNIIHELILP